MKADIAIVGGGIIGSAAAFFLTRAGNAGTVCVIEPDPTYARATTPQGAGGVRQQFSLPENIAQSRDSLDFYKRFATELAGTPDLPDIAFRQQGYLLLVGDEGARILEANAEAQAAKGVRAELLDAAELRRRFPAIDRADIAAGCFTPEDGWLAPEAALQGFRRAAIHRGARYIKARVTAMETDARARAVRALALDNGERLEAGFVINTAGPWASEIAAMTGASLPVVPMCRVQHFWHSPEPPELGGPGSPTALAALPLIKDESGLFFRPEGQGFAGGRPSFDIEPGFVDDIHRGFFASYFEDTVWPMLATLVPAFERLRLERSWAGHYAQNILDGNLIIGPYSKGHDNLITACGFSGHGIMHAPAVGRALAERALTGRDQSLDLSRLEFDRVLRNEPLAESGSK